MEGMLDDGAAADWSSDRRDEDTTNGFSYIKELVQLEAIFRGCEGEVTDQSFFADIASDETLTVGGLTTVVPEGVALRPFTMRLSKGSGVCQFFFEVLDPPAELMTAAYYGIEWESLTDVVPATAERMEKLFLEDKTGKFMRIGRLLSENVKVIGSRRKIIDAINLELAEKSAEAIEKAKAELLTMVTKKYSEQEDTGIF